MLDTVLGLISGVIIAAIMSKFRVPWSTGPFNIPNVGIEAAIGLVDVTPPHIGENRCAPKKWVSYVWQSHTLDKKQHLKFT